MNATNGLSLKELTVGKHLEESSSTELRLDSPDPGSSTHPRAPFLGGHENVSCDSHMTVERS